jgi:hypothetical protein
MKLNTTLSSKIFFSASIRPAVDRVILSQGSSKKWINESMQSKFIPQMN